MVSKPVHYYPRSLWNGTNINEWIRLVIDIVFNMYYIKLKVHWYIFEHWKVFENEYDHI